MTYGEFHLIFTLPVIALLAILQPKPLAGMGGRAKWALPAIAALAFVYTTPWDNYLIYRDVWSYGRDRVIGTIGYVPIEEYVFFILQPVLTGLWLYWLLARQSSTQTTPTSDSGFRIRLVGTGFWLLVSVLGGLLLQWDPGVYLGLILAWAAPILALQWWFGGAQLWAQKRLWLLGTLVPTLYLWIADRIAIAQGIWHISETFTTGLNLLGLPMEEATFFLVTNLLVVQGVTLLLQLRNLPIPSVKSSHLATRS